MLIKTLTLEDVGLYQGRHVFDLAPRERDGHRRPIILFGGHNGAGKTTLLNSIQLCLYGRVTLGQRVKLADYKQLLFDQIHRRHGSLLETMGAQIQIDFEHVVTGAKESFEVCRKWHTSDGTAEGINERLEIRRSGQLLDDLSEEHWNDFLRELLPQGLTQLFFFDGEKIQKLADGDEYDELAYSIRGLLGLDLVERLRADLDVYRERQVAKAGGREAEAKLEEVTAAIASKERELGRLRNRNADFRSHTLDPLHKQTDELEAQLKREGGDFADRRDERLEARGRLVARIEQDEERIRALSGDVLPFAICRELSEQLATILESSGTEERGAELSHMSALLDRMVAGQLPGSDILEQTARDSVAQVLRDALEAPDNRSIEVDDDIRTTILSDLSHRDRQTLSEWLNVALNTVPGEARTIRDRSEELARALHSIERDLQRVPEGEAVKDLHERIRTHHQELGAAEQKAKSLNEEEEAVRRDIERLTRTRVRLRENTDEGSRVSSRLGTVKTIQAALRDYQLKATSMKVTQLEEEVARCFETLCQKDDLVEKVTIDHRTFQIQLHGKRGRPLLKKQLSAGEKQILAISILWALARTSGRPLPVVIDTPLARLDKAHRTLLLERYFPEASHQVVVLSTDTEVDQHFFDVIRRHVSHAYHLDYDSQERRTTVSEGYFWRLSTERTKAAEGALLG